MAQTAATQPAPQADRVTAPLSRTLATSGDTAVAGLVPDCPRLAGYSIQLARTGAGALAAMRPGAPEGMRRKKRKDTESAAMLLDWPHPARGHMFHHQPRRLGDA